MPIAAIGREISAAQDPPIKLVWINGVNVVNQAPDSGNAELLAVGGTPEQRRMVEDAVDNAWLGLRSFKLRQMVHPTVLTDEEWRAFEMPLIFLVICYGFASALALYWTTSNIISIVQGFITKRQPEPELKKRKPRPAPKSLQMPGQEEKKPKKKGPPRTGGGGKRRKRQ